MATSTMHARQHHHHIDIYTHSPPSSRAEDDVLSAFPAPPSYIPPSPARATSGTAYPFPLANSKSAAGKDNRDSGYLTVGSAGSPTSGHFYYTAPSTPLAPLSAGGAFSAAARDAESAHSTSRQPSPSPLPSMSPLSPVHTLSIAFPSGRSSSSNTSASGPDAPPAIGAPPRVPLPPLPRTPSTVSERAALAFAAQRSARRVGAGGGGDTGGRAPGKGHGRKASAGSVLSAASGPSFAEFGGRSRSGSGSGGGGGSGSGSGGGSASGSIDGSGSEGGGGGSREKSRTPRALRIDIPLLRGAGEPASRDSLGSLTSLIMSPPSASRSSDEQEREKDREWETKREGRGPKSPTASLFSVATARSGMSTAEILRTRVSGMLDGAALGGGANPTVSTGADGGSGGECTGASVDLESRCGETPLAEMMGLRTAEDVPLSPSTPARHGGRKDGPGTSPSPLELPLLAPLTPTTPSRHDGRTDGVPGAPGASPSPLELSNMGRTLRAMAGALSPVPPLSDADDLEEDECAGGGRGDPMSAGLLGQFPATPTSFRHGARRAGPPPPPSAFALGAGLSAGAGAAGGGGLARTMSQSRRKPLPAAPRASMSSVGAQRRGGREGATSPDIASMMCATPRPVRAVASARCVRAGRAVRVSGAGAGAELSLGGEKRAIAGASLGGEMERERAIAIARASSRRSNGESDVEGSVGVYGDAGEGDVDADASVDYGVAIARHRGGYDLLPSLVDVDGGVEDTGGGEMRVDELGVLHYAEGEGDREGSESDSDIDLHTPLPHILLREGVLSPHSKVLTSVESYGSLSSGGSLGGRESVASNATNASFGSVMTKSGLYKDARDTEGRRRRHRDGKLLREGLGLTTGLGWSDSEDEDAPSPLTHRLSNLALSRNTSVASFRSGSSSQTEYLSRSMPARSRAGPSAYSGGPRLGASRSCYNAPDHLLSKPSSSAGLGLPGAGPCAAGGAAAEKGREEERGMSPTPTSGTTSSSGTSLPFPPTPREDRGGGSSVRVPSLSLSSCKGASSVRARTPIAGTAKAGQMASRIRPRTQSLARAVAAPHTTASEPSSGMKTPRPLRLPALQQQQQQKQTQYNKRDLHDGQQQPRARLLLSASASSPSSPVAAPASMYAGRRTYGSLPSAAAAARRPPSTPGRLSSPSPVPSPSRLSAPSVTGKPRTGTGMVYRQSSLPPSRVGSMVRRPGVI